ncbi:MAG TPA: ATP-dependent DNA helicase [Candidatus Thermoplasmatota archaeon]|nr:ATP-dependent DNA helicase [Candidatus Thermoplasmatota archaeon]
MHPFPYPPRPHQAQVVERVEEACRAGAHLVFESGTGTGKTVCVLAGTLPSAERLGKRVLYLTRTNSQQRHVLEEFRRLRTADPSATWTAVGLQGRRHLCLLAREDAEFEHASTDELAHMCRDRKRATEGAVASDPDLADDALPVVGPADCRYYRATLAGRSAALLSLARREVLSAEDIVAAALAEGCCAYEATRELLPAATLVVASYPYWFHAPLRRALLSWMRCGPRDLVVVVDEAHNLPAYARELGGAELPLAAIDRALAETREFGDVALQGVPASRLLSVLRAAVEDLVREHVADEDGPLPEGELEARLLSGLRTTSRTLAKAVAALIAYGESVRVRKRKASRMPRSYAGSVGAFLVAWAACEPPGCIQVVARDPPRLVLASLDAAAACQPLVEAHATVHLSGTLTPLQEYRDAVGLPPDTRLASFPSPFPPENRLARYVRDLSTRHEALSRDPMLFPRLVAQIDRMVNGAGRPAAVFFTSHALMRKAARLTRLPRVFLEEEDLGQEALMRRIQAFKREGGALFAVLGGRISEGLDFPAGELELVVVAGLPYPRPTYRLRALERYFDLRFGKGFEYAIHAPMQRKVRQAAGRLIRSPQDRGALVVLDDRAERLASVLDGLEPCEDPLRDVLDFFAQEVPTQRL